MKEKELSAFLASVRRTRFVDYLDPLGETAQTALERRLSWARVSQHDPAYAGEARFLLDNAESLREVLRRELEEDDWVEEADVGREWEAREPARPPQMRENDRVTEIFQADDLEVSSAPQKVQVRSPKGGSPLPQSRSTPRPATPRPTSRSVAVSEAQADPRVSKSSDPARSRTESSRLGSQSGRVAPEPDTHRNAELRSSAGGGVAGTPSAYGRSQGAGGRDRGGDDIGFGEPPRRGSEGAPRSAEAVRRSEGRSGGQAVEARAVTSASSRTNPGAVSRTGTPGPSRRATPGPASRPSGYTPGSVDSLPPLQDTRDTRDTRAPPTSNPPRSDVSRGAARGEGIGRGRNDPHGITPRPSQGDRASSRGADRVDAKRSGSRADARPPFREVPPPRAGSAGPAEVDLDDWDAPNDPISTTGIMRLEDVNPRPQQEIVIGIDTVETVAVSRNERPDRPAVSTVAVVDESATAPSASTRLRRPQSIDSPPDKRAAVMAAMPTPRVRASVEPPPQRSRIVPLMIGLSLVALLLVAVGGVVVAVPLLYTQTGLGRVDASAMELVAPETAPAPQPVAIAPATEAPEPPSLGAVVAPPTPPTPVPEVQPPAAPVQAAAAPKPPKPPKPSPPPEPEAPKSSAPPVDVAGLWIGSTSTASSFKLTILGQTDGDFEGTVEVQVEDGTFTSLAITGKVDGSGAMTFRNGAASFNGKVSGRRVSGTYTLTAGATPISWYAVH